MCVMCAKETSCAPGCFRPGVFSCFVKLSLIYDSERRGRFSTMFSPRGEISRENTMLI